MEELKTCPFCGGQAKVAMGDRYECYSVGCSDDGCVAGLNFDSGYDTEENAIKAWNRREEVV